MKKGNSYVTTRNTADKAGSYEFSSIIKTKNKILKRLKSIKNPKEGLRNAL